MNWKRALVMTAVAAAVLAGCGDGGDGSDTPGDLEGVVAALNGAGIECDGEVVDYQAPEDESFDLGVENPKLEVECEVDGTPLAGQQWANSDQRTAAELVFQPFVCGFGGGDTPFLSSGPWLLAADRDTDGSAELIDRAGEALGVEPTPYDCAEDE